MIVKSGISAIFKELIKRPLKLQCDSFTFGTFWTRLQSPMMKEYILDIICPTILADGNAACG